MFSLFQPSSPARGSSNGTSPPALGSPNGEDGQTNTRPRTRSGCLAVKTTIGPLADDRPTSTAARTSVASMTASRAAGRASRRWAGWRARDPGALVGTPIGARGAAAAAVAVGGSAARTIANARDPLEQGADLSKGRAHRQDVLGDAAQDELLGTQEWHSPEGGC